MCRFLKLTQELGQKEDDEEMMAKPPLPPKTAKKLAPNIFFTLKLNSL